MSEMIEAIFLSQWTIIGILSIAALILSRWAVIVQKEYLGYGLGWLIALFWIVVYGSLTGGEASNTQTTASLNIFQVFLATMMGMVFGGGTMGSFRFGQQFARGLSLYVAFITAMNLILLFTAIFEGPVAQRMIGIFALAFGITSGFILVLINPQERFAAQQAQGDSLRRSFDTTGTNTGNGTKSNTSRLRQIRDDMERRNK